MSKEAREYKSADDPRADAGERHLRSVAQDEPQNIGPSLPTHLRVPT
jgi:hypothetical protein